MEKESDSGWEKRTITGVLSLKRVEKNVHEYLYYKLLYRLIFRLMRSEYRKFIRTNHEILCRHSYRINI